MTEGEGEGESGSGRCGVLGSSVWGRSLKGGALLT